EPGLGGRLLLLQKLEAERRLLAFARHRLAGDERAVPPDALAAANGVGDRFAGARAIAGEQLQFDPGAVEGLRIVAPGPGGEQRHLDAVGGRLLGLGLRFRRARRRGRAETLRRPEPDRRAALGRRREGDGRRRDKPQRKGGATWETAHRE